MKLSTVPIAKATIQHSLTNSQCAILKLEQLFTNDDLKSYNFSPKIRIGHYNFDFYNADLRLAIEVDSYINDLTGIPNKDQPKKLYISSLNIHVLRITDYQIFTDYDEILRLIKRAIPCIA